MEAGFGPQALCLPPVPYSSEGHRAAVLDDHQEGDTQGRHWCLLKANLWLWARVVQTHLVSGLPR